MCQIFFKNREAARSVKSGKIQDNGKDNIKRWSRIVEAKPSTKETMSLNLASLEVKREELDNYEIDPDSLEESYKDCLNEMEEMPNGWDYSDVLERMDPIMYRCGLNDYVDGFDKEEFQDYKELQEEFEEFDNINDQLNDEIFDLESEIEDLESELQGLENE